MGHSEENIPIYVSRTINSYKGNFMKTDSHHHYDHVHRNSYAQDIMRRDIMKTIIIQLIHM